MRRTLPLLCVGLAGLLIACGDDDDPGTGDAGTDSGPEVLVCMDVCLDTGTVRCTGAPPEFVNFYCGELCSQGPTNDQVACIRDLPCDMLVQAAMMGRFPCDIPGMLPGMDAGMEEDAGVGEDGGPDEDAGMMDDAGIDDGGMDDGGDAGD